MNNQKLISAANHFSDAIKALAGAVITYDLNTKISNYENVITLMNKFKEDVLEAIQQPPQVRAEEVKILIQEIKSLKKQLRPGLISDVNELDYLKQENEKLKTVLRELVSLKELKDTLGKTTEYMERQPKAWERAKCLL